VKPAETLAQTVFSIALIVFIVLIVFIFSSTATARTPSVEVVEAGAVGTDPVYRTPSLAIPQPMQVEILEKAPFVDMGFYPIDSDPTRKSLIWNAFPEPLQVEFFEKAPFVDMGFYPIDSDPTRKSLIWNAVREPLNVEAEERMPSDAVREPLNVEVEERMPSDAVREPLNVEVAERMPTQAVREPLNVECCGPTMRFDLKEAASAEILIYSVDGRLVRRLSEALPNGESSLTWDGRDDRGSRAASGVYFARVQANEETGKGKLVLVR
jgi:hypothetical protein